VFETTASLSVADSVDSESLLQADSANNAATAAAAIVVFRNTFIWLSF
jgi:hypothetical protein